MSVENNSDNENMKQKTQNKRWWGKVVGLKPNLRTMLFLLFYKTGRNK
jgi:hypothetical protein